MITDNDRELIKKICGSINIPIGINILNQNIVSAVFKANAVGDIEQKELLDIISRIRAESTQKAREDAADRFCSSCPGKDDGMCAECSDRAAILGEEKR